MSRRLGTKFGHAVLLRSCFWHRMSCRAPAVRAPDVDGDRARRPLNGTPPEMLISTKAFTPGVPKPPRDKDFGPESGVWLKLERNNALSIPACTPRSTTWAWA